MEARKAQILLGQMKLAIKEPDEYFKFMFKSDAEMDAWYIIMSGFEGDNGEYKDGEYLVRIQLPKDFPFSPPDFYFMTPNGLYEVEKKVCINIGSYHKDQARAALKVSTFCNQLMSGFIGWTEMGGGINIVRTKAGEKKRLAAASQEYNRKHNAEIMDRIEANFRDYSSKWDLTKIAPEVRKKLGLPEPAGAPSATAPTSTSTSTSASTSVSSSAVPIKNDKGKEKAPDAKTDV